MPECHRQTDRWTDGRLTGITALCIASHGKNWGINNQLWL